jgi:hypothetical protein
MSNEQGTIHFNEQEVHNLKATEQNGNAAIGEIPMGGVSWAGGGFLILLGGIFLLTRSGLSFLGEFQWMVWMLVPLYWIMVGNYYSYVKAGRKISATVVFWSVFPFLFIITGFLIGWNVAWPFILIAIGAATLLGRGLSK